MKKALLVISVILLATGVVVRAATEVQYRQQLDEIQRSPQVDALRTDPPLSPDELESIKREMAVFSDHLFGINLSQLFLVAGAVFLLCFIVALLASELYNNHKTG